MATTTVLVTGAGGFLGSAVVRRARVQWPDWQILTPTRRELDLSDEQAVRGYWEDVQPTHLVHLAAFARGLGGNLAARERAFLLNEPVIRNPLMAALEFGVESVFFAGTVAEYAHPYRTLPLVEDDVWTGSPHAGEYFYALAKRQAHGYLSALRERWGAVTVHGLLTNMYGPGDRFDPEHGHVAAAMLVKMAAALREGHDEVRLWGLDDSTRDFLHVDDAAFYVCALLGQDVPVVNIASGTTTTMHELALAVADAVGYRGAILWESDKPIGIRHRSMDTTLLRKHVAHEPRSLFQGMRETVAAEPWLNAHG